MSAPFRFAFRVDRDYDGVFLLSDRYTNEIISLSYRHGLEPDQRISSPTWQYATVVLRGGVSRWGAGGTDPLRIGYHVRIVDDLASSAVVWSGWIADIDHAQTQTTVTCYGLFNVLSNIVVDTEMLVNPSDVEVLKEIFIQANVPPFNSRLWFILGHGQLGMKLGSTSSAFITPKLEPATSFNIAYAGEWENVTAYEALSQFADSSSGWLWVDRLGDLRFIPRETVFSPSALPVSLLSSAVSPDHIRAVDFGRRARYTTATLEYNPRYVGADNVIFRSNSNMRIPANSTRRVSVRFRDPDQRGRVVGTLSAYLQSFTATSAPNGTGSSLAATTTVLLRRVRGGGATLVITNASASTLYLFDVIIRGEPLIWADAERVTSQNLLSLVRDGATLFRLRQPILTQSEDAQTQANNYVETVSPARPSVYTFEVDPFQLPPSGVRYHRAEVGALVSGASPWPASVIDAGSMFRLSSVEVIIRPGSQRVVRFYCISV